MNHALAPYLPLAKDETVNSWVCRMAEYHTGDAVSRFLGDLGLSVYAFVSGSSEALSVIAAATGENFGELRARQPERTTPREFRFKGHTVTSEFMPIAHTSYCAACLLEDDAVRAASRVGRWPWLLSPVRTCERHGLSLSQHRKEKWDDILRNLSDIAPRGHELERLTANAQSRMVSPLQEYVVGRFNGNSGAAWLDAQTIEQAARTSEMIGVLAGWGATPNLNQFTSDNWDSAGKLGFEITKGGEASIQEFFRDLQKRHPDPSGNAGPQAVFGRLYQWLQFGRSGKDRGPIKEVLRSHILETMAIEPGTVLLGHTVETRRFHSVPSLAKQYSLHPATLRRVAVLRGLIGGAKSDLRKNIFDAQRGEAVAASLLRAITVKEAQTRLNATRLQAQMLIREGFIKSVIGNAALKGGAATCIDPHSVEEFLKKLSSKARSVSQLSKEVRPITKSAEISGRPTREIIKLLISGGLERVETEKGSSGFSAVHVDPGEIIKKLPDPDTRMGRGELAQLLKISHVAMKRLSEGAEGEPLLNPKPRTSTLGARMRYSDEEVDWFQRTYATLGELVRTSGLHHAQVLKQLRDENIGPVRDPEKIKIHLFKRGAAFAALQY